jgi:apurinic endonuclease APN1
VRGIGLHLRVIQNLFEVARKAVHLKLPFFQCFLIAHGTKEYIALEKNQVADFVSFVQTHFAALYVHGSYKINLANPQKKNHRLFFHELALAKQLGFTHMVLHPGSINGEYVKMDGIDAVARTLNTALKKEDSLTFVLENTAHRGNSIGSDLHDFHVIRQKIDKPERVQFCIDTAHAYAYGYNIKEVQEQQQFIQLLEETVGIENIALIHLNDTLESLGSYKDRHTILGSGTIGELPLKNFILSKQLANIPALLELPLLEGFKEEEILNIVRRWH